MTRHCQQLPGSSLHNSGTCFCRGVRSCPSVCCRLSWLIFHLKAFTGWTCSSWAKMNRTSLKLSGRDLGAGRHHMLPKTAVSAALRLGSQAVCQSLWLNSCLALGLLGLDLICRVSLVWHLNFFLPLSHIFDGFPVSQGKALAVRGGMNLAVC